MKKNVYDERQLQQMSKIGTKSFEIMFASCTLVIIVQLAFLHFSLQTVAGETFILLIGGIAYIACNIKEGLWNGNNKRLTTKENLIYSILFSCLFTAIFAFIIAKIAHTHAAISGFVCAFFIGIFILGFITLSLLSAYARYNQKKKEEKYDA